MSENQEEIIEILAAFERDLKEKLKENKSELQEVRYYQKFTIKGIKEIDISGVFVTEERDSEGNTTYHLYCKDTSKEILVLDSEGNMQINPAWREAIRGINIEKTINKNDREKGRLQGVSERISSKEVEKQLEKEDNKKEAEEQIQEDLGNEEDLDISYYRQIKDQNFSEQIGQNLNGYQEIGLAYSKSKNAFILVGKNNGTFEKVEGFEEAQPTFKTVMSIDEKGEKVEKKVPHALMETNNDKKELSITIGQYGYIEVGTVDRLPCETRVERQVGEQDEGEKGRTEIELNRVIKEQGTEGLTDYVKRNENRNEEMETGQEVKEDVAEEISQEGVQIERDDYIPNTNVTWGELADQCGFRGEDALKHTKEVFDEEKLKPGNENKENEEIVNDIVEREQEDYHGPQIKR